MAMTTVHIALADSRTAAREASRAADRQALDEIAALLDRETRP
jgi:hypothetical protein